jgi:hypothetical protein
MADTTLGIPSVPCGDDEIGRDGLSREADQSRLARTNKHRHGGWNATQVSTLEWKGVAAQALGRQLKTFVLRNIPFVE